MTKINFKSAKFLLSASNLKQCPPEQGAEVAFAGRSNGGKSSAINALTQNKNLARTSKTPGRTQLINFFQLHGSPTLRLVDLPGYGYAKVSQEMKKTWHEYVSQYLNERQCLKGLVLIMDIRHPLQDIDTMLIDWAVDSDMPLHVLLTKSDKLSRSAAQQTLRKCQTDMKNAGVDDSVSAQAFSALNGDGVDQLGEQVGLWLQSEKQ